MIRLLFILILPILFTACVVEEKTKLERLYIVTTTGIIEDAVENIVGDSADVSSIMGPGIDPHTYKPSDGDIEMLDDADVIIANGLNLEGNMLDLLIRNSKDKPVIYLSDGIPENKIIKSSGIDDPHIWSDPTVFITGVKYVMEELSKMDTLRESYYLNNYLDYELKIYDLDEWIKVQLDTFNREHQVLIAVHNGFTYFSRENNIEVKSISEESEEISDMVDFVIEHQIKSIFFEYTNSDETAQSIVDDCKERGYELEIRGPLYSDALGEPDSEAGTYIGMMKENVRMIVTNQPVPQQP